MTAVRSRPVRALRRAGRLALLGLVLAVAFLVVPDSTVTPAQVTLVKVHRASGIDLSPDVIWILAVGSDARPGEDMTRTRGDALQLIGMNTKTGAAAAPRVKPGKASENEPRGYAPSTYAASSQRSTTCATFFFSIGRRFGSSRPVTLWMVAVVATCSTPWVLGAVGAVEPAGLSGSSSPLHPLRASTAASSSASTPDGPDRKTLIRGTGYTLPETAP